jgi:hypothetical protein
MAVEIVVNARTGKQVQVEKSKTVNNGQGASFYLLKKDAKTGKRLFFHPNEWAALSEDQKKEAQDFTPSVNDDSRRSADRIVEQLAGASPLTRKAAVDLLKNEFMASLGLTPEMVEQLRLAAAAKDDDKDATPAGGRRSR